jgi:plastocyanin domain-containing protein
MAAVPGGPLRLRALSLQDLTNCPEYVPVGRTPQTAAAVPPLNACSAFTPAKTGDIAFACGMNRLKGTVVVG